jgi:hypothetical protein
MDWGIKTWCSDGRDGLNGRGGIFQNGVFCGISVLLEYLYFLGWVGVVFESYYMWL